MQVCLSLEKIFLFEVEYVGAENVIVTNGAQVEVQHRKLAQMLALTTEELIQALGGQVGAQE